jgi:hypothetical protein
VAGRATSTSGTAIRQRLGVPVRREGGTVRHFGMRNRTCRRGYKDAVAGPVCSLTHPLGACGSQDTSLQSASASMRFGRISEANKATRTTSHALTKIMLAMTSVVQCTPNSTRENATAATANAASTHASLW